MNLQTKRKTRFVTFMLTCLVLGCVLSACSKKDDPEPPSLSLNPTDFEFTSAGNESQNLEIKTNGDWSVVYCPDWLSCSSRNGTGNTIVTLTTISKNNSGEKSDQLEIRAANKDGQETVQRISVKQKGKIGSLSINTETGQLIMSYGMACVVEHDNNTQYFYYKIFTDSEFSNIKGNDDQIVQEAKRSGTGWTRVNIPSSGGVEICYDQCLPKTRYVFVAVPFTSNGEDGIVYTNDFMTKSSEEEPLATITPESQVTTEVHDGDTGPWYKWEVKKASGTCNKYYTYACASDTKLTTMENHKGAYGEYDERDGVKVAWNIWLEHKGDQTTHSTTFNKDNASGREKLFRSYSEGATQWLVAKTTDKYLQIVTWGVDENNNYSGIVCDMLYRVENGVLIDVTDPAPGTSVGSTSMSFESAGGTQKVTVTSNEEWTASSSQSWCSVTPTSGSNSGYLSVTCSKNDAENQRTATITVTGKESGKTTVINVTQSPKSNSVIGLDDYDSDKDLDGGGTTTYSLSVSPTSMSMLAVGESKTSSVTSNDSWTVSSNQSWCTVSPTSGSNNGSIKVTTAKNTSTSSRTAVITVKGANSGSKTITVTQDAYTLSVSQSSLQMSSDGESKTVSVTSNDSWTVTSNQSWCTVSPSSGSNNGTLTIKTTANSSNARTATVTINGSNSGRTVTVSVSQDGGTTIGLDDYDSDKSL